ncbi:hypothetical protein KAR91_36140 [Candidatus Pacearchaeota archaeon]|nr:hypothetical protein [Candidatus Pacearchaeota archaeon]
MRLYKRNIKIVIGQEDGDAISIENLYIQIEIKKNISGKPNEGIVNIFNLAENTENHIQEKGVRIRVFAGHDDRPIMIHDGDIRRVDRDRSGVERITIITLGGNVIKLSQAVFNKSYSGQVSVKQIVLDSIPSFNIDATDIDQIPDDAFLYDFSFTGKTSDLLDKILNPIGVQWFESDNFIKFSANKKALDSVVLLTKDTGLIGSASITDKGVKFKSVLNGRILLNEKIKIESTLVNGVTKVIQILHKGDNRDGDFITEGIGTEIEQS